MKFTTRLRFATVAIVLAVSYAQANVIGVDTQNFNPITSGLDFVTVQSSETLKPGILNFGFFLNYAVNTLPYFEANPTNRGSFNDSLFSSDVNMGLGLLKNWDIGLSFPAVLSQSVQNTSIAGGQFSNYGNTEVRPNTKVHLVGDDSEGVALVASVDFNRIQNSPYAGVGAGPTYNLEVAVDKTFGAFAVGVNAGHRWRNPGTQLPGAPIQPFKNALIYSVAANYLIPHHDTKIIGEIFGGQPTDTSNTDVSRTQSSLEALIGIKHDFSDQLAFHVGAGTELGQAIASPDWRIYTGINYTFGPLWRHSDEVDLEPVHEPTIVEAAAITPVIPVHEEFVAHNILFEFDSDVLAGDFAKTLDALNTYLHKAPVYKKLTIEGHTDSVGKEEYNLKLSQRRADAIKRYMVKTYKLNEDQVESIGYGPTRPIADNGNYQGRQENRRVEFKIDR